MMTRTCLMGVRVLRSLAPGPENAATDASAAALDAAAVSAESADCETPTSSAGAPPLEEHATAARTPLAASSHNEVCIRMRVDPFLNIDGFLVEATNDG